MPDGKNPCIRENFQRNCISRTLSLANNDDLIIISDADETPNPEKIKKFDFKKNIVYLSKRYIIKN